MSDPHPSSTNRWIIALAVMSATFMEVLDTTVVNVSLPHIAGNLSVSITESTWVLTSYLVANAIVLPMTGWLATVLGRKRLLQISILGFTSASLLCGLAPSLPYLILFRVLQGTAGGVLQPLSQAILLETFPLHERGKAMGFWGIGMMVAPIFGPVFGGWVTDSFSWRWLFYVNLPVGAIAMFMTQKYLVDPPYLKNTLRKVDYWGIALLIIGIGTLQLLLDKGQEEDWFDSRLIITFFVVAAVALITLIVHVLTTEDPIVDLRVLRDRTYAVGLTLITVLGFVLFGSMMVLPVFLQTLLGYPALQAGIALAPRGLGAGLMMPVTGALVARVDSRILIGTGLVLASLPLFWLGQIDMNAGFWDIFWPQLFQGAGMSLIFVPLSTTTMASIPKQMIGNATSLFSLMRNLGAGIGIAVMGTLLSHFQETSSAELGARITPYDATSVNTLAQLTAAFRAAGSDAATAATQAYAAMSGMIQQQASMLSFITLFRFCGAMFLVMLPLVLLMRRPDMRAPGGPPVH